MAALIAVQADELKWALDAVKPACVRGYPARAEECVCIGDGAVECASGEMRITARIASLSALPATLVSFARLHSIARESVGAITLDPGSASLVVKAAGGRWTLTTADPGAWPKLTGQAGAPVCRIPADQFCRCVSCVLPAASSNGRWAGVKIESRDGDPNQNEDAEDKVVHFTATDGRRLHTSKAAYEQDVGDCDLLVPQSAMRVACSVASRAGDAAIQLCLSSSAATFTAGTIAVRASLLDHTAFPKWRKIVPSANGNPTVVTASSMLSAVRQAAVVTSETSKALTFAFGARVTVRAKSPDYGEAVSLVEPIRAGASATASLDPQFASDFLRHVAAIDGGATVSIEATDKKSAVVLRHDDSLAVISPISVEDE